MKAQRLAHFGFPAHGLYIHADVDDRHIVITTSASHGITSVEKFTRKDFAFIAELSREMGV